MFKNWSGNRDDFFAHMFDFRDNAGSMGDWGNNAYIRGGAAQLDD